MGVRQGDWLMPKKTCQECGAMSRIYNEKFDAYFCAVCDKWLEKKRNDGDCEFCTKRPEKPSEAES